MKRVFGLDLIRFFAIFSVISVHFFLNNGFYTFPVKGGRMFISINLRWLFFSGVPLFLLLTGYLNNKKKIFILPKLFKKKGLQKNVNPLSSKLF